MELSKDFTVVISGMILALGHEVTPHVLYGFWMGLDDVPLADLREAVRKEIRSNTSGFIPTPGRLRELAGMATEDSRAIQAWKDLIDHAHIGPYRDVVFRDPVLNATIREMSGSWAALCDRFAEGMSKEAFIKADFMKTYRVMQNRRLLPEDTGLLKGIATDGKPPKRIGRARSDKETLLIESH